jgi:hypothetical protein
VTREHRERRRATFEQAADLYDRARPGIRGPCSTTWPSAAARSWPSSSARAWPPSPAQARPLPRGRDRPGRVRGLATARRSRPRARGRHPHASDELDRSRRFGPARFRRYEWELPYTTASYLDLLRTSSGHRDLNPEAQSRLLGCIADLIDNRHGGEIINRYLTELRVAPAVQPPT